MVVDRPMSKWLKVTVQCFDASGREMWQEEASAGGALTGGKAPHDTLQKPSEELNRRLGQPGLQQGPSAQKPAVTASSSDQKSVSTESASEPPPRGHCIRYSARSARRA